MLKVAKEPQVRRLALALSLSLIIAAFVTQTAAAKNDLRLTVTPPVSQVEAGSIWHVTLEYTDVVTGKHATNIDSAQVMLRNTKTGAIRYADAYSYGTPGRFTAMLPFPKSGTWTLTVDDGGPYAWDNESKPFTVGAGGKSFPTMPVVGGAAGALVLGLALLLFRRRSGTESLTAPGSA